MNFQEKLIETTADLRGRAHLLACQVFDQARTQADVAAQRLEKRVTSLKGSFEVLNTAGRAFNKVARRHAIRFVKQNATLAAAARDEVTSLARTTFDSLKSTKAKPRARRASPARKRAARARTATSAA